jgi:hypothetical protein
MREGSLKLAKIERRRSKERRTDKFLRTREEELNK